MEGRRRRKQETQQQPQPQTPTDKKKNLKNPQTNIKELKKDIETFETKVNLLLENVQVGSMEGVVCIVCQNLITTAEYHDLPCQHILCETCVQDHTQCPQCFHGQPSRPADAFCHARHAGSSSSSSSSDDN
jgi:hypothetical protein